MALTNAELTDEVRDLKKRVKDLEEEMNVVLWDKALEQVKEGGA